MRASPKSRSFTCPVVVTKTFAGLMSRWTMPYVVRDGEHLDHLPRHRERVGVVHLAAGPPEAHRERVALQQLHDEERRAVGQDVVVEDGSNT